MSAGTRTLVEEVMATGRLAGLPGGHFIDGAFVAAAAGGTMASFDPGRGRAFADFAAGDAEDVDRAVAAARRAFAGWRRTRPAERSRILRAIAEGLRAEADRFAVVEALDVGKRLVEAEGDLRGTARAFDYYAGAADKLEGAQIPLGPDYLAYTLLEPVGIVAQIVPWNYPLSTAARGVAPALAAGCCVVLKPAETTPMTALMLADLAHRCGLPAGVLNVVTGTGAAVGTPLTAHPGIDHITFTGSVATGVKVMTEAARNVTRVQLELGGKSPHVLLADADLDRAIPDVMGAIFENAGQICSAGSRLIVEAGIRDAVVARLAPAVAGLQAGHGLGNPDIGPVNSAVQLERIAGHVARARQRGCAIVAGGAILEPARTQGGWFYAPTLVEAADPRDPIVQEEVFGPVLTLQVAADFDEALALANGTDYALVAGLHTRDLGKAHRFAREVEAGQVYINEFFAGGVETPFGGNRASGFGRAKGMEGMRSYCSVKSVTARIA
jgi:acyl-CoA reductase-like NAD-dependent aldehyde dehydrogenase